MAFCGKVVTPLLFRAPAVYCQFKNLSMSAALQGKRVAVVLSGSGVYDGSEVHEASACLVHLTRAGATPTIYAPDVQQLHVINHTKGEESKETRNVLVESARIARGKIQPLHLLASSMFDAVVFPGGFGVAKNLSTFAVDGDKAKINPEVERVIKEFHSSKKPLAFCCIAPILAAKVLKGVTITMGQESDEGGKWPYSGSVATAKQWGAVHQPKNVDGVTVDKTNLVVTTPAFMYDTPNFHEIYDGVGGMIKELLKLIK
jgi:enhancing lycopene biosynthesis protein 2